MRLFIVTILCLWSVKLFSQYPTTDEHTSIGGAGEWYNQSGHANMGVEGGSTLCYNIGVNYSDNQTYVWESSDYGTQFSDDGLDSVYFSVNLTMDIRSNGDLFYMGYLDGGTWSWFLIPYRVVATPTTFYVWAPNTTTKFRYRLFTGGNGTTNGNYVHIGYTTLNSSQNVLPIELVTWTAQRFEDRVVLKWVTASEINNERFEVYWSPDGENWEMIGTKPGAGSSSMFLEYHYVHTIVNEYNYYKLRQVDFDGRYEDFDIIVVMMPQEDKNIKYIYYSVLGQKVDKDYNGLKIKKEIK